MKYSYIPTAALNCCSGMARLMTCNAVGQNCHQPVKKYKSIL